MTDIQTSWEDVATTETEYFVERDIDGGGFAPLVTLPADTVTYTDVDVPDGLVTYRSYCSNAAGDSGYSNETVPIQVGGVPYTQNQVFSEQARVTALDTNALGGGNSALFTMSLWIAVDQANQSNPFFFVGEGNVSSTNRTMLSYRNGVDPDLLQLVLGRNTNSDIVNSVSVETYDKTEMHHILISRNGTTLKAYVDDVATSWSPIPLGTIQTFGVVDSGGVAAQAVSSGAVPGRYGDVWFESGVYLDLDVEAERRKFINANLTPVFLGANGELPLAATPDIFMGSAMKAADWNVGTNLGTAGTYILAGSGLFVDPDTILVEDSFTRANGTLIVGTTPDVVDNGNVWTLSPLGGGTDWDVQSNLANKVGTSIGPMIDCEAANGTVSILVNSYDPSSVAVAYRNSNNTNNFPTWRMEYDGTDLTIANIGTDVAFISAAGATFPATMAVDLNVNDMEGTMTGVTGSVLYSSGTGASTQTHGMFAGGTANIDTFTFRSRP